MASKETLLVPQEEFDRVLTNLKKKGEAYLRAYLIRSGADGAWAEHLVKDELFHHALVLKGAIKERLPFKKQVVGASEVQKESAGGSMEMFLQLMKSQETERKAEEARRETERKAEEARRKAERDMEMKVRDDQAKALLLLVEKMNDDKKTREQKEEEKEQKLKIELEEKDRRVKEDLEERDKRLKEEIETRDKAHKELLEKVESRHRGEAEALRNEKKAAEQSKENTFKKYADILKHSVQKMPEDVAEIPVYLDNVERRFEDFQVPDEIRVDLLQAYMSQKALRLLNLVDKTEIDTFGKFKIRLLHEFKLSPSRYRDMFQTAEKQPDETWTNCATRLFTLHRTYLQSRKITTLDQLTNLIVSDRMKDMLPKGARNFICNKEIDGFMRPYDTAINVEQYQSNYDTSVDKKAQVFGAKVVKFGKKVSKDSEVVVDSERVGVNAVSGAGVKCFNCEGPHFRRDCPNVPYTGQNSAGQNSGNSGGSFRGRFGFRGGFRARGSWMSGRGFRGRGFGRWNNSHGYGQHGVNGSSSYGQTANVNRLLVVENDVVNGGLDRECEFAPDIERLVELYDGAVVNVDSVSCMKNTLLSSPENVTIRLRGSTVDAIVDFGAQISCVHARFIPDHLLKSEDLKSITLEGAFRDRHVTKIIELPCRLIKDKKAQTFMEMIFG